MSSSYYSFVPRDTLMHDYADAPNGHAVDALVASGDCFITIATQLDDISHQSGTKPEDVSDLEEIIRTLIYLQRHYAITKKTPNYRQ